MSSPVVRASDLPMPKSVYNPRFNPSNSNTVESEGQQMKQC
jgi:hypothetical protein